MPASAPLRLLELGPVLDPIAALRRQLLKRAPCRFDVLVRRRPEADEPVHIVATANSPASVDILEIAGADHVVQLGEILGSAMAARGLGFGGWSHTIGSFAGLQIAEAGAVGTDLVDRTLAESQLRRRFGVGLIGIWERGDFAIATADTELRDSSMLLLAGTSEQLAAFDRAYATESRTEKHAVIVGGGSVGRAIGRAFANEGVDFAIVEQLAERQRDGVRYVIGDAADRSVLEEAGLADAGSVLITTHDDNVNVYLTRYCRGLRPDARIVSRSRLDRNVSTLYRAGADAVLSYADTRSAAIWNQFRGQETLLVSHGLNLFRTPIPDELAGKTLAEAHVYRRTQCNVVAVEGRGTIQGNPDASTPLPSVVELVMIGTDVAEARFSEVFPGARRRPLFERSAADPGDGLVATEVNRMSYVTHLESAIDGPHLPQDRLQSLHVGRRLSDFTTTPRGRCHHVEGSGLSDSAPTLRITTA